MKLQTDFELLQEQNDILGEMLQHQKEVFKDMNRELREIKVRLVDIQK